MKSTLLFLLLLYGESLIAQDPFEGVITYKVTTRLKNENNPYKDYLLQKYGDSLQIYISQDGSLMRKYYGKGDHGMNWHVYDSPSNYYYAKWKGIDTIYYYSCSDFFSELKSIEEGKSEPILGKPAKYIKITTFDPIGKETLIINYHYSGEQFVSAKTYAPYKEGYIDKVYEKSQSHILKYEMDLLHVYVTMEAIRIEPMIVNRTTFKIPESIPKKKW